MNLLKTSILAVMCLFLTGLGYVKVQTEIKKTSYAISVKMQKMEQLVDLKYSLLYNFYKYASVDTSSLENSGYQFSNTKKMVRIEIPKTGKSSNRVISLVRRVFSLGSTAQAEE